MGSSPNVESIYRLTSTQEGILFHAVQNEADGLYVQQFTAVLVGELDAESFQRAWADTVARHPALRALFTWKKRPQPLQVVRRTVDLPMEFIADAELLEEGAALDAFLEQDRRLGLPLDVAPLMRLTVVNGTAGRHRLIWTFHHIALDGWSMRLVLQEVLLRLAGEAPGSPAPSHQSFVDWLGTRSESDALEFWSEHLAGFDEPTRLAVAAPQPSAPRGEASHADHTLHLSQETTAGLVQAARAQRVTLSTALRATWALALARFSGESDVVFGATVAGRPPEIPKIEEIVGMFIHTIPVRTSVDLGQRMGDWCAQLQRDQLDAQPHETTSLAAIQRASDVAHGTALFDSILVMENHAVGAEPVSSPLRVEEARYLERSHYPLALLVVPGDQLELILVRDRAQVTEEVGLALLAFVEQTLARFAERPEITVGELTQLGASELDRLERFSRADAAADPLRPIDVLQRIEAAAEAHPEAPALRCPGATADTSDLTYRGLMERVAKIASGLQGLGVGAGDLVGVRLPRGSEALATMLGVLRLGAAYVPIDPESPEGRVAAITGTVELRLTVGVGGRTVGDVPAAAAQGAKDVPAPRVDPEALAYVLFTSGTTGVPKGVEITRDALARSTAARDDYYSEQPSRFLLLSPLHFDSSVAGIFWTLACGGTLVLPAPSEERDALQIIRHLEQEHVTHTLLLPSLYEVVLEAAESGELDGLKTVIVAGEASTPSLIAAHAERTRARLVNEYGPTEGTVWATAMELTPTNMLDPVPIGRPIGEVRAYVLDTQQQPAPLGVSGELYLGGPTLARGYAGDSELTAARFLELSPLSPGSVPERVYRTGDRVRFDGDGHLVFLGRVDRQVKIRGQRIELGEVEAALQSLIGVHEAAAVATSGAGGQAQLIAFASGPGAEAAARGAEGSTALSERLTGAMRPRRIVAVEDFPRTASGKIDRPALAALAAEALEEMPPPASTSGRAATGEIESTLLTIWREVLGVEDIAVDQDFYGLGGDSLTSIRLVARAHKAGIEVELADFAEHPTIEGMALAARALAARAPATPLSPNTARPTATSGTLPLTPIQSWFFDLDLPERQHWNQAVQVELRDLTAPAERATALEDATRRLVERHEALRLSFRRDGERWSSQVDGVEVARERVSTQIIDLRRATKDERVKLELAAARTAQTGFDLEAGRLFAARFFVGDSSVRALLVAHHLVVDAVSWGTILDEVLEGPAEQANAGATYRDWVAALAARADSAELREEAARWIQACEGVDRARGESPGSVASERAHTAALSHEFTDALVTDIHSAYGTRPREILLTALSRTLARSSGLLRHLIDVEGHGREAEAAGAPRLDVSSTVGWLTTVWPLALTEAVAPDVENQADSVKATKERVRAVPGSGLGFGLLAHMTTDAELRRSVASIAPREMLFNYLGRVDGGDLRSSPVAALDDARMGAARSASGQRAYPIECNAWIADGALRVRWSYSQDRHSSAEIEALSELFLEELCGLIRHCQDPDAGGVTPSDFPLAGVDQAELDRISKLLGGG